MRHAVQVELIRRALAYHADGSTQLAPDVHRVPAAAYVGAEYAARERTRWFEQAPVVAGMSADAPQPGDYFCSDVAGIPLLLVRGHDGHLRSFLNACRHRASPVARGRGSAERALSCPFHGWSYGLDGRLEARPRADAFACSDDPAGLIPLPCDEAHGVVLVRPSGGAAIDASSELAELADDLDAFGFANYHFLAERSLSVECNWKLVLETFLESYHVPALHRDSVARFYLAHPMLCDPLGTHLRFPVLRRSLLELAHAPEAEWDLLAHCTMQYWLAPAALLNFTLDHLVVWQVSPEGSGRCAIRLSLYAPSPPGSEAEKEHYDKTLGYHLRIAGSEDFPQQERVQRVLGSGGVPEVRFGRNEVAAIRFHQVLAERLRDPSEAT